ARRVLFAHTPPVLSPPRGGRGPAPPPPDGGTTDRDTAAEKQAHYPGRPAPAPRTLIDILDATARQHPAEPALDDGRTVLGYRALAAEVEQLRRRLAAARRGRGGPGQSS
ncbi:hypothetical protein, partial [Kitasatospora purpeofusca]|uniref:hypothetical protein n=1 Tax=Kitasatospora purpeofusca TaxID=67352 RepID=UPI0036539F71